MKEYNGVPATKIAKIYNKAIIVHRNEGEGDFEDYFYEELLDNDIPPDVADIILRQW